MISFNNRGWLGFEGSEIDIGSNRALGSQKKRSKEGTLYSGKICDSGEGIETERVLCSCFFQSYF